MSTCSTKSRCALGWCQALTTRPTRTSSLEKAGCSDGPGAGALAAALAGALPAAFAAAFAGALAAAPSGPLAPAPACARPASSCSNRIEPELTGAPAVRFRKSWESVGMGRGPWPSFRKMASAARGRKGAKKWPSTKTASRSWRQTAARSSASAGSFQGSSSASHLFVAPQARIAASAASESRKPARLSRVWRRSWPRSKGAPTRPAAASGTLPPQRLTARFTRFPRLSQSSALCMSRRDSSENFTSSPKGDSRQRYHRSVSLGSLSSSSWGSTTLP
mmetsp:Transcript_12753/g.37132  ORF Transcript_12753/g.37132 Transcript_12753/m.37132 type:complete len:277 (-) Transcript_12753:1097-1927(-)